MLGARVILKMRFTKMHSSVCARSCSLGQTCFQRRVLLHAVCPSTSHVACVCPATANLHARICCADLPAGADDGQGVPPGCQGVTLSLPTPHSLLRFYRQRCLTVAAQWAGVFSCFVPPSPLRPADAVDSVLSAAACSDSVNCWRGSQLGLHVQHPLCCLCACLSCLPQVIVTVNNRLQLVEQVRG